MNYKIDVGTLLRVETSFIALRHQNYSYSTFQEGEFKSKPLSINDAWYVTRGEVIEIRYPYAWHFRNNCNTYAQAPEDILRQNCSFFGVINPDIRFENRLSLNEILSGRYYTDHTGKNQQGAE